MNQRREEAVREFAGMGGAVPDVVAERIEAINHSLAERGLDLRLLFPRSGGRDREILSQRLMEVLAECQDRDAFELVYVLNSPLVHDYARRRRSGEVAMDPWDVVEETFLRIFLRCRSFAGGPGANFTGWLLAITENVIRDGGRRYRRTACATLLSDPGIDDPHSDPIRRAIATEVKEVARQSWGTVVSICAASILRLPPRWRQVLEMREGEGLSYAEIAGALRISKSHVSMLLHRARKRVRDLMTDTLKPYEEFE